jgi:nitric oxide reductase large subunit
MEVLRWLRVVGDTVFSAGAVAFVVAVIRLTRSRRTATDSEAIAA